MSGTTTRVASSVATGMAAAATVRNGAGGRNVASVQAGPIEGSAFAPQIGVKDNRLLQYEQQQQAWQFQQQQESHPGATPFVVRKSMGFRVEDVEDRSQHADDDPALDRVTQGISGYESTQRLTSKDLPKPGSVLNYVY